MNTIKLAFAFAAWKKQERFCQKKVQHSNVHCEQLVALCRRQWETEIQTWTISHHLGYGQSLESLEVENGSVCSTIKNPWVVAPQYPEQSLDQIGASLGANRCILCFHVVSFPGVASSSERPRAGTQLAIWRVGWLESSIHLRETSFPQQNTGWWFQLFFVLNVHSYLGKIPILTHMFQLGWFNHQPEHDFSKPKHVNFAGVLNWEVGGLISKDEQTLRIQTHPEKS